MKYKYVGAVLAANFRRLSMPIKLSYAVTYRCNLKCSMCRIWDKELPASEIQPRDLDAFLKGSGGLYWFGITGGEPFLRDDVFEIAETALKNCPDLRAIHFATNGTMTHKIERFMQRLRAQNSRIQIVTTISIDGPPPLHDRIRGRAGVWNNALESFHLLKQFPNTKPQFGFTLSRDNLDQFENTIEALQNAYPALCFDDITVNIFQRSSFYYENQTMPPIKDEDLIRNINRIRKIDRGPLSMNTALRRLYLKHYLNYLKTKRPPLKCQSFSATAFLDPFGNLFPCAVYDRKLLNIQNTQKPLKDIWQLEDAATIHRECAKGQCPGCWSPCDAYSAIGGSLIPAIIKP
jgi:Fe-coproporphyrin III synthase